MLQRFLPSGRVSYHWMRSSRLDAFGKMVAELDRTDADKQAILARLRDSAMAAMANLPRLMAAH